jgi:hypothetical protein
LEQGGPKAKGIWRNLKVLKLRKIGKVTKNHKSNIQRGTSAPKEGVRHQTRQKNGRVTVVKLVPKTFGIFPNSTIRMYPNHWPLILLVYSLKHGKLLVVPMAVEHAIWSCDLSPKGNYFEKHKPLDNGRINWSHGYIEQVSIDFNQIATILTVRTTWGCSCNSKKKRWNHSCSPP